VLAITLLVVSLGVADSINPVTIAIAIYLASTRDPQRRLAAYTAGVFAVYVSALAEQRMGHKDRDERQDVQRVE
jgi:hypothetical protein